jgi:hypothetical protein
MDGNGDARKSTRLGWLTELRRNRLDRAEPKWAAPVTLPPAVVAPPVRLLEQFHLGGAKRTQGREMKTQCRGRSSLRRCIEDAFRDQGEAKANAVVAVEVQCRDRRPGGCGPPD